MTDKFGDNNARDSSFVLRPGDVSFGWDEGHFVIALQTDTDTMMAVITDDKLDQMLATIAAYTKTGPDDLDNPYAKNVAQAALADRKRVRDDHIDPLAVSRSMDAMFSPEAVAKRDALVDDVVGPEYRAQLQRIKVNETPEEHKARATAKRAEIEQRVGFYPDGRWRGMSEYDLHVSQYRGQHGLDDKMPKTLR